jgi:30S ribosomal protein S31
MGLGAAALAGVAAGGLASGVRPVPQPIAGSQTRRVPARPKRRRRGIEDLLPEKTGTDGANDKRQISIILIRAGWKLKGQTGHAPRRAWPERADDNLYVESYTMGKGDKRTKRGKLFKGTFGKRRLKPQTAAKRAKAAAAQS